MNIRKYSGLLAVCALAASVPLHAVILVQTNDPGYYNNNIGTALNGTNGGEAGPFPNSNDATLDFLPPYVLDLTSASAALGNWLTDPLHLNSNWQYLTNIPNSWTPGTEVAVIYQFNTLGATNVMASFGVDNGIYAWIDGVYLGGGRKSGGVAANEHVFDVGDLSAGTHFLQLLLEDHGSVNGYSVQITADTFIPGPPPQNVPDGGSSLLGMLAVGGLAFVRRMTGRRR